MINLLPQSDQRQLAAARSNTLLLRYIILLGIFVLALVIEILGVYVIMNVGKVNDQETIAANNAKATGYATVKQQATQFRTDLATAKFILDKQVPYTTLMLAISQNLPSGAVLDKLAIDPATFGTATSLNVNIDSYDKAIVVKSALQNMKVKDIPIFTSVSFQSVSSREGGNNLPFSAVYDITYSKGVLAL